MKLKRVFCLGIFLILLGGESVLGASFSYFDINHSIYESGNDVFRISFAIRNDNGSMIYQDVVKNIELIYDPSNSRIRYNTDNVVRETGQRFSGQYDSTKEEFVYFPETFIEYYGPVGSSLPSGEYLLRALVDIPPSGEQYIEIARQWDYFPVVLPVITYNSFDISNDGSGNFLLKWDAPEGLNDTTHSRICIKAYDQKRFVGDVFVRGVPTDLGRLFLPADIVQQVVQWGGDSYGIELNVRTNDSRERTYSKTKVITSLKGNIVGDVNNDGKIGLEEAINALQVLSSKE